MNKNLFLSLSLVVLLIGIYYVLFPEVKQMEEEEVLTSSLPVQEENDNVDDGVIVSKPDSTKKEILVKSIKGKKNPTTRISFEDLDSDIEFLLNQIQDGELDSISKDDLGRIINILKDSGKDYSKEYAAILNLYKSNLSKEGKIFIVDLLAKVATYDSALTLTSILDIDDKDVDIRNKKLKALDTIIYSEDGSINGDVSSALGQYWENSDNTTYKPAVAKSIFKIGNIKESKAIIDRLNNPSSKEESSYIANAMKEVVNEDTTALLYKEYSSSDNSDNLRTTVISVLPYIANPTAALSLYDWSTRTSDIDKVKEYFTTLRENNSKADMIIKEELFNNQAQFASPDVEAEIERIFKK